MYFPKPRICREFILCPKMHWLAPLCKWTLGSSGIFCNKMTAANPTLQKNSWHDIARNFILLWSVCHAYRVSVILILQGKRDQIGERLSYCLIIILIDRLLLRTVMQMSQTVENFKILIMLKLDTKIIQVYPKYFEKSKYFSKHLKYR